MRKLVYIPGKKMNLYNEEGVAGEGILHREGTGLYSSFFQQRRHFKGKNRKRDLLTPKKTVQRKKKGGH